MTDVDTAVRNMLQGCELQDIVTRRFSARLRSRDENLPAELGENEAAVDMNMSWELGEDVIDYSFRTRASTKTFEATAEVVARYAFNEDAIEEEVAVSFANRVAFFAVYPYLRETIHSSTSRLPGNQALLLPVVQDAPGFVKTEEPEEESGS